MTGRMEGKVVLVTGGSSGIGRATALAFAREGAKLSVAARRMQEGQETIHQITEAGGEAVFIQTDVTKAQEVKVLVERTVDQYGQLDCSFNNAGIEGPTWIPTADYAEADWDQVMDINVKGTFLCIKYAIPHLLEQGKGAIVNMSSVVGLVGGRATPAYTTSKHALIGLTKAVALEYADRGIRVNAVCPGVIRTELAERLFLHDPEIAKRMTDLHPMGRIGAQEEVAEAVVWLCSDAASFVTGTAMPIDGGYVTQ